MHIGYTLAGEAFGPAEFIRQAVLAEKAGFDFVEMSDHFHPWLEDARVFDLPDEPPLIAVAASGAPSAKIAAELGDGLIVTEPKPGIVQHYREADGGGPAYAEAPLAWAPDERAAAQAVLQTSRWALTGWKVMIELTNPVNFDAASSTGARGGRPRAVRMRTSPGPSRRGRAAVPRCRF